MDKMEVEEVAELVEISNAIAGNIARAFDLAEASQVTPEQLALLIQNAYEQNADLVALYADRFEKEGHIEWASICRDWKVNFLSQAQTLDGEGGDATERLIDFIQGGINTLETNADKVALGASADRLIKGLNRLATLSDITSAITTGDYSKLAAGVGADIVGGMVGAVAFGVGAALGVAGAPLVVGALVIGAFANVFPKKPSIVYWKIYSS